MSDSVEESLQLFLQEQLVDYKCEECHQHNQDSTLELGLEALPLYLILHVKR